MVSRRRRFLGLGMLFFSGALFGVVVTHIFISYQMLHAPEGGRMGMRLFLMTELIHRLDLRSNQIEKIDGRVTTMQEQIWEVRREMQPRIISILEQNIQASKSDLDDKQQKEIDSIFEILKKRWGRELNEPNKPFPK